MFFSFQIVIVFSLVSNLTVEFREADAIILAGVKMFEITERMLCKVKPVPAYFVSHSIAASRS